MNAEKLMKFAAEHGADGAGIAARFGDDCLLYEKCFNGFINSRDFDVLQKAIDGRDYSDAIEAAHALKGLAGSLGLSDIYSAICALVEALRTGDSDETASRYSDTLLERDKLTRLLSNGEEPRQAERQSTEKRNSPECCPKCGSSKHNVKPSKHGTQNRDSDDRPATSPVTHKLPKRDMQNRETHNHSINNRPAVTPASPKPPKGNKQSGNFAHGAIASIVAVFIIALTAFNLLGTNYNSQVEIESGQHLIETGKQIGLYLEEQVAHDWGIVNSISRNIVGYYEEDSPTILRFLREQREAWRVTSFMLYTENGGCYGANGEIMENGVASDIIAQAYERGNYLSVVDSQLVYTLPLSTDKEYLGSRIVAISMVRDMETFLNDMSLSAYNDAAWIYLTDENGTVISMYSHSDTAFTYNVKSIFNGQKITRLDKSSDPNDVFASAAATAFFAADGRNEKYVVSVPISTDETDAICLRLYYIVPEDIVNDAMNDFSGQLTVFSAIIIALLVGLASLAFFGMYRNRKKQFDAAITSRDRMFDLLIKNTRTVFGLFDTSKSEPVYLSANAADVLGANWSIAKLDGVYEAHAEDGGNAAILQQVNERLREWDGVDMFKSGYLIDDATAPPSYYELTLMRVGGVNGDLVGILQDMTTSHEREEVTKNAMDMARRSNEAKTRFLTSMSHDIRTPMNAIMNMSKFALESTDDPEQHAEYLSTIYKSSEHMLNLINDVLDMSRIESGQTVVACEPFNLKAELQKSATTIEPLCAAKRQNFKVSLDGIRTEAVRGDAMMISHIVTNLLSNANKFTPEGGSVSLTAVEMPSLTDDIVSIRFTVADTGIGISEENLERIFEPFSRANDKQVEQIEGTGLGLSICKNYVDAMGGTISCESREGMGSTFTVELFFKKTEAQRAAIPTIDESNTALENPFTGMRCLVIEDVAVNRIIAKKLLERLGFEVDLATDGDEGADMFIASKPNTYDVIYMDIQMPTMNGYQATAMIRQSAHPQSAAITILAMSANVFAEDIEKARLAGMDGYVGKPIVAAELRSQTLKALKSKKR